VQVDEQAGDRVEQALAVLDQLAGSRRNSRRNCQECSR
jgi:hypothetical protein